MPANMRPRARLAAFALLLGLLSENVLFAEAVTSGCGSTPCDVISVGSAAELQLQPGPKTGTKDKSDADYHTSAGAPSPHLAEGLHSSFENTQLILKKPVGDRRQYQHTVLANGLEVLNVNDRSTKTSAFALAVTAGFYYDPPEHYGLAHLTEHSLFLGTERYPVRSGFDEYLAKNGGASNAYTAEEVTVYYGNLNSAGFNEGLDRFSDFFNAPLLNESYIYGEVSAVVSEHSKNVQNPQWFCEGVMLSVADPSSPLQHFHTGDEATLKNLGPRNLTTELVSYFKSNYCPPRFKLVTFGSDSVETQLHQANKTFGSIPRAGRAGKCAAAKKAFKSPEPFPQAKLQKWLLVQGTMESATLWMLFPIADLAPWTESHPINYLSYMIGYGGKNSLNLVLRDQLGLADFVSLSADDSSAGTMVWITAAVTPAGAQKPEAVMDVIFTFLAHTKKGCSDEALQSLAKSAKLVWDWQNPVEASDAASRLAEGMTRLTPQQLLAADDLMEQPNKTRVLDVLQKLQPAHMNAGMVRPDAEKIWQNDPHKQIRTLPHYGVQYNVSTLDHKYGSNTSRWQSWGVANQTNETNVNMTDEYAKLAQRLLNQNVSFEGVIAIELPPVIDGIPENMTLCHASAEKGSGQVSNLWGATPKKIGGNISNRSVELWFRKGWVAPQPRVEASMTLRARKIPWNQSASALDVVKLQIGMHLLADELNQRLADVGYKGFFFSVSETHSGVYISLSGFTPNLLNLTDRMLTELDTALDNTRNASFHRVVAGLKTDFTDFSGEPVKAAFKDQKVLLTPRMHSKGELADALFNASDLTFDDTKTAVEDARHGQFYATSVVMGNYGDEDAKHLHQRLIEGLGAQTNVTADEVEKVTPVVMPAKPVEIRKTNPREGDQNHVTVVTILAGAADVQKRVLLGLVGGIYSQVVFAELRTKMELGYVVGGGVSEVSTVISIDCYVQGSKKLPDSVEADCEHVWAVTVPAQIANLDDATFLSHKDSFKSSLLEGPLTTSQELNHFEDPILLGGCLNLRSAMLAFLETVTSKDQLLEAWNAAILPKDGTTVKTRKKVVVKYFKDGMNVPDAPTAGAAEKLFREAGLNGSILERVITERSLTRVVSEANSTIRDSLVKEGGYFPSTLHCDWKPPTEVAESGSADDDFNVLVKKKTQTPAMTGSEFDVLANKKKLAAAISAGGHQQKVSAEGRKAPRLMRSDAGQMRPILRHDATMEAATHHQDSVHGTSLLHGGQQVRHSPLQPQPSRPAASSKDFAGRSSRGLLPGLASRVSRRLNRPQWAKKLLDFEH